jgi:hypothetical protein
LRESQFLPDQEGSALFLHREAAVTPKATGGEHDRFGS